MNFMSFEFYFLNLTFDDFDRRFETIFEILFIYFFFIFYADLAAIIIFIEK